jgi:hypothetical protein
MILAAQSEFPEMLTGTSSKFKVVSKWMNIFEDFHNRTDKNNSISQYDWLESLLVKKNYGVTEIGPIGSIASLAFNDILHTLNIKCDAMIGHSNGENAALISSGILNFSSKDKILKILQLLSEFPQLKNKNGVYQSAKLGQEIDGWKILEINIKNIKIQKGLQSEIIRILK